jgi:hypothetical protein
MKSLQENGWRATALVSAFLLVLFLVNAAIAQEARRPAAQQVDRPDAYQPARNVSDLVGAPDAQELAQPADPSGTPVLSCAGGAHRRTWVYTHADAHTTTALFPVLFHSVTVTAAPGTAGLTERILVRFTAESACYGGTAWCSVRILIAGVEAAPVVGVDFAFDSTDAVDEGSSSWEGHALQRCRIVTIPSTGTYPVQIDWGVSSAGTGTTFRLDDWALTVEQYD